jgi:hypothetical protein
MLKKLAILNHQLDASAIHMDDATGANVEMSHFAVAHLSVRQADVMAARMNQRVGILAKKPVISGLAGKRDRVGFNFSAISPAIEDDKNERFWMSHTFLAFGSWLLALGESAREDINYTQ